jgi:hypothetical protein
MSAVVMRVAKIDWCPSRNVTSVILTGFLPVEFIMMLPLGCGFDLKTGKSNFIFKNQRNVRSNNFSIGTIHAACQS